jgi:peroxiredoxin
MGHRLSFLTLGLLVSLAACSSSEGRSPAGADTSFVDRIPPVPLVTLTGGTAELVRVANGRVALVSFWATWCEACEREMDALNRLQARTAQRDDVVVLGVAVGEERDKVAAFARRRGLSYAQLVDEHYLLADALGQRRLPATLVLDRSGRIVFRGDALDARSLDALQRAMAAGPSVLRE